MRPDFRTFSHLFRAFNHIALSDCGPQGSVRIRTSSPNVLRRARRWDYMRRVGEVGAAIAPAARPSRT